MGNAIRNRRTTLKALASACALGLSASYGYAVNGTWSSTAATSDWGTASNWGSSTIAGDTSLNPAIVDVANFNASTQLTIVPDANRTIGNMSFNAASGSYTVNGGSNTLFFAGNGAGAVSDVSTVAGATLTLSGPISILGNYQFISGGTGSGATMLISGTVTNGSTLAASQVQLKGGNTSLNLASGVISNGAFATSVAKLNTGTWMITGVNTYTGGTNVSQGTLIAGGDALVSTNGVFGNSSASITVGVTSAATAPATLLAGNGGTGYTIARAISVAATTNTATGLQFSTTLGGANTGGTSTFTGNITLSRDVILQSATGGTVEFKTGTWSTGNKAITVGTTGNLGTVKLTNNLTTTGGTTAAFGTFLVNGTLTSGVTVNSGAILGGTGTIASGASNVAINGFLSPGSSSASTLTVSTGNVDISGAVAASNSKALAYDLVAIASSDKLAISAGTLAIGSGVLEFDDLNLFGATGVTTGVYTLVSTSGGISGTLGSVLSGTVNGISGSLQIDGTGKLLQLNVTATPEPASMSLLAIGGLGLLRRRKMARTGR